MRTRGFSMPEVMLALVVLTVAVLGLLAVFSFSLRAQAKSGKRHAANLIATTLLNQAGHVLAGDFERDLVPEMVAAGTLAVAGRAPHPEYPDYEVEVVLLPEPNPDLKGVEVRVFWTDQNGPQVEYLATRFWRGN